MRFPRQERLKTKAEFSYVFARPEASHDRYFRVLGRHNGMDYNRLGMAVSRKCCRKATGRNRLKRVIRESFRHRRHENLEGQGIDFVVLPRAQAVTICNRRLTDSLDQHWSKLNTQCLQRQTQAKKNHRDTE